MRHLKRLAVIMLVVAMILSTAGIASAAYSDTAGQPCEEAVDYLSDLGVIAGFPDGTYKPDATLTRAQAAKIIVIMKYGNDTLANLLKGATPFSDVTGSHWASGFIALAKNAGIINGYPDGTFKPEGLVTYAELAKMLVEAAGLAPLAGLDWPANYVGAAQAAGILDDVPDFAANSPATRGDCAIMAAFTTQEVENPATGKTLAQSAFGISSVASVEVTAGSPTVKVSGTVQFTAVAKDSEGNAVDDATFTWTATGGLVGPTGLFAATTPGSATVTATADGKSGSATVAVYGAATSIQLSAPGQIVANGKSTTVVTASVRDAQGNLVGDYTGNVTFLSSNPGSVTVTPGTATFANGEAVFTLKSAAAGATGASAISAASTGLTGAAVVVTPVAQVLTTISVTADPTTLAADGASQSTIGVSCKDQAGQTMAVGVIPADLRVTLTTSSPSIASFGGATTQVWQPGNTFPLIASTNVGSTDVTGAVTAPAAYVGYSVASKTVSTAVIGSPYKLAIDPITDAEANATGATSTEQSVVVRVLDVNGNQVTGSTAGTVAVNVANDKTTTAPVAGTPGAWVNGKATFKFTDTKAETVVYTATGVFTAPGIALQSATAQGVFIAGPANKLVVSGSPVDVAGTVRLNADGVSTGTITAKVTDSQGNAATAGAYEVTLTKTTNNGATQTFAATKVTTVNGVATFTVQSTTTGSGALADQFTATSPLLPAGGPWTVDVKSNVTGAPSQLFGAFTGTVTAGVNKTVKVEVRDGLGTPVMTDNGRSVTLTVKRGTTVKATYTATTVNGIATFTVNVTQSGSGTTAYSFAATSAGLTAHELAAIPVAANTPASLAVTVDRATLAADGGSESRVTATLKDAYGNSAKYAALDDTTVNLAVPTATYGGFGPGYLLTVPVIIAGDTTSITTTLGANSFRATTTPGSTTITATGPAGKTLTSGSATVNSVVVGGANRIAVITASTGTAGTAQDLKVYIQDFNGNTLTGLSGGVGTIALNPGTGAIVTGDGTLDRGVATYTVTNNNAVSTTFTATWAAPDPDMTAQATVAFGAGAVVAIEFESALPATILGNGSSISIVTFIIADINHNAVTTVSGTMKFEITAGNDFATLVSTTAPVVGGKAVVYVQSKLLPAGFGPVGVTVKAWTTDIYDAAGVLLVQWTQPNAVLVQNP